VELRHIRYFLAVAEEGHFSAAAKRLNIVQPALSMQIRALEAELGTLLFERNTRRVVLTEAGMLFKVEAERTIQQAARAKDVGQRAARGEVGTVRVGFVGNASIAGRLSADVSSFKVAYPYVDLEFTELNPLEQIDAVLKGHLDVGYVPYGPYECEELGVAPVAAWPWILALHANHALTHRSAITAMAVRDETFIIYAAHAADDAHLKVLRRFLGQEPRAVHHVPNTLAVLALAAAGVGLALVPASLETLKIPNIAYRPVLNFPVNYELKLVSRRNETSSAIRHFIEIARKSGDVGHSRKKPRRSKD
jgi:DNA-binding transcriptional LysR family regulator